MIVIVTRSVERSQEADELKQMVLKRIHTFLDYLQTVESLRGNYFAFMNRCIRKNLLKSINKWNKYIKYVNKLNSHFN